MSTRQKKGILVSRRFFSCMIVVLLVAGFAVNGFTLDFPTQPITAVVGVAAGGAVDTATRAVGAESKKFLNNQDVLVVNKPGSGHMIAISYVISARPDGYTLGSASDGPYVRNPYFLKLAFDPLKETIPIIAYSAFYQSVVVRSDSPFKTFKDFVDYARNKPDEVSLGHGGVTTSSFLNIGSFAAQLGIKLNYVPYSGDAPAILALLGGHIMVAGVGTGASLAPQIKAGKVRVLAICEGHERIESLPDVPTLYELGFKDAAPPGLLIIYGPKGMPEPIAKKIEDAFLKGSQTDGYRKFCKETDTFPWTKNNTGQALKVFLETTLKNNGIMVKKLGVSAPK